MTPTYNFLNRKIRVDFVDGSIVGKLEIAETGGAYVVDGVEFEWNEIAAINKFNHIQVDGTVAAFTVRWA